MIQTKEIYKNRIKNCLWCGEEYRFFPYEEKITKYCSRSCLGKAMATGRKHRPESIERMRKAKIGKIVSLEIREKIRKTLKEKHLRCDNKEKEGIEFSKLVNVRCVGN